MMNIENILLNEANRKRPHVVWSHLYEMSRIGKSTDRDGKWISGSLNWGKMKSDCDVVSFTDGEKF